ncbi:Scaffold attachment factor B2 [Saguinus oedipus]|uniref:Scaffold attachment factor B2 n=1 Tax=Saguinus oedipus TaxID=9490 RepID=A0ABQ9TRV5_SAGOE|nr:Scaffold attachment factor B2 [Saguinus oedipus]
MQGAKCKTLNGAVKEEGQDPDEMGIELEATSKKSAKRYVKESLTEQIQNLSFRVPALERNQILMCQMQIIKPASAVRRLKMEEEGTEDNGLEEDSRDGQVSNARVEMTGSSPVLVRVVVNASSSSLQEDMEASLENLQNMGMMDISVLDETEVENSSAPDFGEDGADGMLDSFCDSKEYVAAQLRQLPAQLPEHAVGNLETRREVPVALRHLALACCSCGWGTIREHFGNFIVGLQSNSENEKILDILGETCKSEPVKEESSELEQPFAQDTSSVGPDRKLAEEEDLFDSAHPEEGDLDLASESTAHAQSSKADSLLAVVKREPVEQPGDGERTDCEPVGLEPAVEQSSAASELAEASSEELAEAPTEAPSPEARDSKEDGRKFDFEACNEVPPAPKESSTSEGADQKMRRYLLFIGRVGSSSGRNLWVSGLSSTTRATDLKNLFSKYGKLPDLETEENRASTLWELASVFRQSLLSLWPWTDSGRALTTPFVVGAKVVTNARSPGARCYGFVTMSTSDEATKCISHLHRTELHGRMISVEKAKNEPAGKKLSDRKECEVKKEKLSSVDRHHSVEIKIENTEGKRVCGHSTEGKCVCGRSYMMSRLRRAGGDGAI